LQILLVDWGLLYPGLRDGFPGAAVANISQYLWRTVLLGHCGAGQAVQRDLYFLGKATREIVVAVILV
jgi:hypothetical protein